MSIPNQHKSRWGWNPKLAVFRKKTTPSSTATTSSTVPPVELKTVSTPILSGSIVLDVMAPVDIDAKVDHEVESTSTCMDSKSMLPEGVSTSRRHALKRDFKVPEQWEFYDGFTFDFDNETPVPSPGSNLEINIVHRLTTYQRQLALLMYTSFLTFFSFLVSFSFFFNFSRRLCELKYVVSV